MSPIKSCPNRACELTPKISNMAGSRSASPDPQIRRVGKGAVRNCRFGTAVHAFAHHEVRGPVAVGKGARVPAVTQRMSQAFAHPTSHRSTYKSQIHSLHISS